MRNLVELVRVRNKINKMINMAIIKRETKKQGLEQLQPQERITKLERRRSMLSKKKKSINKQVIIYQGKSQIMD